jgi:catechol 2,3-dioxygenase-like lactoylglutathione lyase family enzyme
MMIDHTSLGVRDFDRAVAFYGACLGPLGYSLQRKTEGEAAFGVEAAWGFFLYPVDANASIVGERNHVAFSAPDRDAVEAFHRTAVAIGARSTRPPGGRPDISPDYFGTVLVDPEGHTLEAVFWSKAAD